MKKIITLFILIFCQTSSGQEKKEKFSIYLDFSKVSALSKREVSLIRKSTLEAVFSSNRFLLNLQKPKDITGSQYEWYTVEINITPRSVFHDFNLKLINNFDAITYNQVIQKGIARDKLQLTYRKLIYKLLYGENYNVDENKILINQIISLPGKSARSSSNPTTSPGEKDDKSPNPESEKEKIEEAKEDKKEKKRKKKDNQIKLQDFDTVDLNLETIPRQEKKVSIDELNWLSDYTFSSGYTVETNTVELLLPKPTGGLESFETDALNQKVDLGVQQNLKDKKKGNFNQLGINIAKIISEDRFQTPIEVKISDAFFVYIPTLSIFVAPRVSYMKDYFVNLTSFGSGPQLYVTTSLWYGVDLLKRTTLFDRNLKLSTSVSVTFYNEIESDNGEKSFQGQSTQYHVAAEYQLFGGLYIGVKYLNYSSEDIDSQIFSLSRNETLISLIYQ